MSTEEDYADRKVPLTPEQIAQLRAETVAREKEDGRDIQEFTCDGCGLAPVCAFAFDPYNTNGDCLASK